MTLRAGLGEAAGAFPTSWHLFNDTQSTKDDAWHETTCTIVAAVLLLDCAR
jgi:hypothetical protein